MDGRRKGDETVMHKMVASDTTLSETVQFLCWLSRGTRIALPGPHRDEAVELND